MEGFIKVLKKNNLPELKRYFFYLTYNNRSDKFIINKTKEKTNKYITETKISLINPIKTYWDYRNSINKEWKKDRIKALELILSFSTEFNYIMKNILGQTKWEKIYQNIIFKLIKDNIESKHILFYFHKIDKKGYRYHVHTIIYPYKIKENKSILYTHIEKKTLEKMKKEFNDFFILLKEKYKKEIIEIIKKEVLKIKKENNININELLNYKYPKLSKNLGYKII